MTVLIFIGSITSAIIMGVISTFLTYYFTIKSKKSEMIFKFKEKRYSNLLILLQAFIETTSSKEMIETFFQEYYKSWIYSSDDVVRTINTMVKRLIELKRKNPERKEGKQLIGNIVLAMRKDLLNKTKLNWEDFKYIDVKSRNQIEKNS